MNDHKPWKVCCDTMTTGDTCRQCGRSMSDLPPLNLSGKTNPPPQTTLENVAREPISKLPSMRDQLRLLDNAFANSTRKIWAMIGYLWHWRTHLGHLLDKCNSNKCDPDRLARKNIGHP